jgi:hypothetical protein
VDGIALFQVLMGRHVVLSNPSLFIAEQLGGSNNTLSTSRQSPESR